MGRNVILIGFMGTGKSTVGQALSEALGWRFVDSDAEVAAEAGQSIPDIFATAGEARFRELETEALTRLTAGQEQVIATGGGAVLKEENRRLMLEGGLVVALHASVETIVSRVREDKNRPLLQGGVEERVRSLMEARKEAYSFAPVQIDTDSLTPEEAADAVRRLL